ncbi:MAG: PilZ domain-containing protein [Desulfobacterota bacterium]|nr:PilZ domain-containing protein [Thermodesulfobacteriota bacterium]
MEYSRDQIVGLFKASIKRLMNKNKINNKRKYRRLLLNIDGIYNALNGVCGTCRISDISQKGIGIELHGEHDLRLYNSLILRLKHPRSENYIDVVMTIKWMREAEHTDTNVCYAGGLHSFSDPSAEKALLEFAYTNWFRTKK